MNINGKRTLLFFGFSFLLWISHIHAGKESTAQNGSTVSIHYTLTVDGKVIDSSIGKKPLSYVQGKSQIISGLEEQLKGTKRGDKKRVVVPPAKAYGPVDPEAYQNVSKKTFRDVKSLKVGTVVTGQFNGRPIQATIVTIDEDTVTLDLNHPLAGKNLQFDIEVMDVKSGAVSLKN